METDLASMATKQLRESLQTLDTYLNVKVVRSKALQIANWGEVYQQHNSRFPDATFPDFKGRNAAEIFCTCICSPGYTKSLF